ncbi:acyl-CoA dehydrogenase family protein [Mycolicibacterium sp. BiH015]|uniref:acyl-CoA dehydrogenase family protein n=1 Tax=Mycolicibacterium sp. BiH015 TaxID=3018808 RepID=UPI0022E34A2E|nr:acyl-CoA dehydrogenase family protein [Mycolicibacterium sp. BiH015]MDA2890632.1 acyl-CoA dehydrogenase family protein [Mycolicibacterium sp. BiH015]
MTIIVAEERTQQARDHFAPLFAEIARGTLTRERDAALPTDAVAALKEAGFGTLRVPVDFGGWGLNWPQVTALWIDLAAADANLTQALRGHFVFAEDTVFRHRRGEDQSHWFGKFAAGEIAGNAWTETGATAMGDAQTEIRRVDGRAVVNGRKFYTTGTIFAEWADVYVKDGDGWAIALVDTRQPGVVVHDDWNGFGQRGTGTGTTEFHGARVEEIVPFDRRHPYQTGLYQLNLVATLAGIARAILADVTREVQQRDRNFSHASAARVRDDPQVLGRVGEIWAAAYSAEAIALRLAEAIDAAANADDEDLAAAAERTELESAAAQVTVSQLVIDAASNLFDTLGASATSTTRALDRHWRNARTVASHNPRLFKAKVLGAHVVNGAAPPYAWGIGRTER